MTPALEIALVSIAVAASAIVVLRSVLRALRRFRGDGGCGSGGGDSDGCGRCGGSSRSPGPIQLEPTRREGESIEK